MDLIISVYVVVSGGEDGGSWRKWRLGDILCHAYLLLCLEALKTQRLEDLLWGPKGLIM